MSLREQLFGKVQSIREKLGDFGEAGAALATRAATRIPVVGAAAVGVARGLDDEEQPQVSDEQNQKEIATQIDIGRRSGFRTDEFGNSIGTMTEEEFRQEFGPDAELPPAVRNNPQKTRQEVRLDVVGDDPEIEKEPLPSVVNDEVIDTLLRGEGLNSTPEQLEAAFQREGAVGPGQHRQIFFDTWNPVFKRKFGRDYDRENLEDVKIVTKMALEQNIDRFGSLEAALIAYNKGPSVVQDYIDDPNVTFDDDPYVQGFKQRR